MEGVAGVTWRLARRAALVLALAVGSAAAAPVLAQTRVYIDAIGGSDENSGRSEDQAWRSIAKINRIQLRPGDTVLLRRGSTWKGGIVVRSSGRPGLPISFGAYGTGPAPVLAGARSGVEGNGQSHIVVRGLLKAFRLRQWLSTLVTQAPA